MHHRIVTAAFLCTDGWHGWMHTDPDEPIVRLKNDDPFCEPGLTGAAAA